jgi:hypothetical protein
VTTTTFPTPQLEMLAAGKISADEAERLPQLTSGASASATPRSSREANA